MARTTSITTSSTSPRIAGFTLLELIVTIAVVSMMLTFGVPAFEQVVNDSRRTADVNELLYSLSLARSEAIKRGRHVTICKSANGTSCGGDSVSWEEGWIVFVNTSSANLAAVDAGEEILLAKGSLSRDAAVNPDASVSGFAAFRPDGRAFNAGGFTRCDDRGAGYARGVFVSATGRPAATKERPDGSPLTCS